MDKFIKEQQLKYPNREVKGVRFGTAFKIYMNRRNCVLNNEPIPKEATKFIYKIV